MAKGANNLRENLHTFPNNLSTFVLTLRGKDSCFTRDVNAVCET